MKCQSLILSLLVATTGCDAASPGAETASESKAGSQTTSELGPLECPLLPDETCPEGCWPLKLLGVDPEAGCLSKDPSFKRILCSHAEGGGGAVTCGVWLETGSLHSFPTLGWAGFHGWGPCTLEQEAMTQKHCTPTVYPPLEPEPE
ncbi:MAG: hypothetical protein AMXMBFR64_58680 [Myxococcales bacterium]